MDRCDTVTLKDDPEDILSTSLQCLYDFHPITFSAAGSVFTYPINPGRVLSGYPSTLEQPEIELVTPDTDPSNWALHASSIWVSSLFIADHLEELQIDTMRVRDPGADSDGTPVVYILELGAGAGLPSILLARMYPHVSITASDYPDDRLIHTLSDNVRRNGVSERCRAVPYAWGTDTRSLVHDSGCAHGARFDIIFAADTLWNPALHTSFLDTLCMCLKRSPESRIHLVAGLHTGRYTIQSFLDNTKRRGLGLLSATEREVGGTQSRPWDVSRAEGENEGERRKWVVWMILKWEDSLARDALRSP